MAFMRFIGPTSHFACRSTVSILRRTSCGVTVLLPLVFALAGSRHGPKDGGHRRP